MSFRSLLAPATAMAFAVLVTAAPAETQLPPFPGGGSPPSLPGGGAFPPFPGGGDLPPFPGEGELPPMFEDGQFPPNPCEEGSEARFVDEDTEEDPGVLCETAMPDDLPEFAPAFLGRLWRFDAEVSSYDTDENVLNATIGKVRNLPKRFRDQDDEILDADANVLVSRRTRVYDEDGKRIRREGGYGELLDEAEDVLVLGKLLPPWKWGTDEDDEPVVTIRAKRVTITG